MVINKDQKLSNEFTKALAKAKSCSRPILYSEVQAIDYIDAYSFFEVTKESYEGSRFFWKNAEGNHYLVGIGIGYSLQSTYKNNRFFHLEKEWKELLKDAVINREPNVKGTGTGPTMVGGLSFDPLKNKTSLWKSFGDISMFIPKFMLTIIDDKTYLTTNIVCTSLDNNSLIDKVIKERENLFNVTNDMKKKQASILKMHEVDPEGWKTSVDTIVERLKQKEADKVVLARELDLVFNGKVSVERVLEQLRNQQSTSYIFSLESGVDCFIGATPERLALLENQIIKTAGVAGSIPRGKTQEEDEQLGNELLNDHKNLVEHHFVVDMIKASMEKVCSTLTIPNQVALLKTKHIQHLYTPIEGKLKENHTLLSIVDLLHPTPALGGLPKEKAKEMIREVETLDRGLYGGPIGWMDYQGNGEFAVAIRSGLIQGDRATLFAGCGVVEDSDAQSEYLETKVKFNPMLSALGGVKE